MLTNGVNKHQACVRLLEPFVKPGYVACATRSLVVR